jgi:hypothetical protein
MGVDDVASADAFVAGFLGARCRHLAASKALLWAHAAATLVTARQHEHDDEVHTAAHQTPHHHHWGALLYSDADGPAFHSAMMMFGPSIQRCRWPGVRSRDVDVCTFDLTLFRSTHAPEGLMPRWRAQLSCEPSFPNISPASTCQRSSRPLMVRHLRHRVQALTSRCPRPLLPHGRLSGTHRPPPTMPPPPVPSRLRRTRRRRARRRAAHRRTDRRSYPLPRSQRHSRIGVSRRLSQRRCALPPLLTRDQPVANQCTSAKRTRCVPDWIEPQHPWSHPTIPCAHQPWSPHRRGRP